MLELTPLKNPYFVLASTSPRRRQLFGLFGFPFEVIPADIDESPKEREDPIDYVRRLAREKACRVASTLNRDALVLASDTIVVDQNQILGKPVDPSDAVVILRQLAGKTHQVYTAIHLVSTDGIIHLDDLCITDVPMRNYNEEEIQTYVATGDPIDKAGAYAIQHKDFHPVEHLNGCYASVMGLPLCHVSRTLRKAGVTFSSSISQRCQAELEYLCPVYQSILDG